MNAITRMCVFTLMALPITALPVTSLASDAASIESDTLNQAASSQVRIDALDEKTQTMKIDIDRIAKNIENMEVYKKHLTDLVQSQEIEKENIYFALGDIEKTKKEITPLMYRMIDQLSLWIAEDLPLLSARRQGRIQTLKDMIVRADLSDAQKLRRILETYQIELDYGAKLGIYTEKLTLEGVLREVDVLHFGRISLIAKSLKGDLFWYFNQPKNTWLRVPEKRHPSLQEAFDVANKINPPTLISLPLSLGFLMQENAK